MIVLPCYRGREYETHVSEASSGAPPFIAAYWQFRVRK